MIQELGGIAYGSNGRGHENLSNTANAPQLLAGVVSEKAGGKSNDTGGRLDGLAGPNAEFRKTPTPQNEPVIYPTGGALSGPPKPQESIAVKPAVVVPSSSPSSPPFEQEKDAQILDRPVISSFNGQQATAKALSGSSTGKTGFSEPDITMWDGPIRHDISAADLAQSAADGYVRLDRTLSYNGAYTGENSREPATAQEEFVGSTESHEGEVASGREDAVPRVPVSAFTVFGSENGSAGKFGSRSGGGKRKALATGGGEKVLDLNGFTEEIGVPRKDSGKLTASLQSARDSNNEKTHLAQVERAVAFQLNTKLAEVEDDYNNASLASRDAVLNKARGELVASEEAVANVETGQTGAFMAIGASGWQAEKAGESLRGGERIDALLKRAQKARERRDYDESILLSQQVLKLDKANEIAESLLLKNHRERHINSRQITADRWDEDHKLLSESVRTAMLPQLELVPYSPEWNEVNARSSVPIQAGDQEAQKQVQLGILKDRYPKIYTEIGDEKSSVVSTQGDVGAVLKPAVALSSLLTASSVANQQKSFATLRSPMTFDGKLGLAQCLRLIGGDHIGYSISPGANEFLGRQVQLNMRDETTSRGVLRAVRGAGLQAQFNDGLVKLDVAQRPLNPTDTQSFDLPTFKELFGTAPMQNIAVDPVQTVAIDADTASYSYAKARIAAGQEIDPTTIKPEHFINAMPMDYPPAQGPEAFSLYAEAAPSPFARAHTAWGPRTALVSIGAVAKPARADERRPLALTLAVDCSGSMAQPGALARVKLGLQIMTRHLRADDRVAIVAFGDQARVVLPSTPGNDQRALLAALDGLTTGGATNASEGLTLAYQMAAETAASGVESRVLLATDGGTVARADELLHRVTAFKDRGITLVVVGCGETYHAGPLQELATKGDGQHYFIGSDDEAQKLFSTTLLPDHIAVLAKDAKLQVTWNPQRVSHARLIGYDQRRLATKDFRNNAVDAGELSQDTQVTALFEVLLVDGGTGQLGTAAVRYHDTRRQQVRELACPLPGSILASQPSDRLRLLACAAATAEWLQRGWWSNVHLITPAEIATQLGRCPQPIAAELKAMIR